MILGDVEETVTTIEIDEETYEEVISHFKFASFLKRYAQFFLMYILLFQNIFLGISIDQKDYPNVVCSRRQCHSGITSESKH